MPLWGISVCWMAEFSLCVSRISALDECLLDNCLKNGKWFEPRSLSRLCGLIVRVRVVPRMSACWWHWPTFRLTWAEVIMIVMWIAYRELTVFMSIVSLAVMLLAVLNRTVWLGRDVIGCWFVRSCCYWLWNWLVVVSLICLFVRFVLFVVNKSFVRCR